MEESVLGLLRATEQHQAVSPILDQHPGIRVRVDSDLLSILQSAQVLVLDGLCLLVVPPAEILHLIGRGGDILHSRIILFFRMPILVLGSDLDELVTVLVLRVYLMLRGIPPQHLREVEVKDPS